jgi:alpha-tubulin suppressor-like RCC1 family protein
MMALAAVACLSACPDVHVVPKAGTGGASSVMQSASSAGGTGGASSASAGGVGGMAGMGGTGPVVVSIDAGHSHTCAVISDGRVRCRGDNIRGQLGDGTTKPSPKPVEPKSLFAP